MATNKPVKIIDYRKFGKTSSLESLGILREVKGYISDCIKISGSQSHDYIEKITDTVYHRLANNGTKSIPNEQRQNILSLMDYLNEHGVPVFEAGFVLGKGYPLKQGKLDHNGASEIYSDFPKPSASAAAAHEQNVKNLITPVVIKLVDCFNKIDTPESIDSVLQRA